jgi:hypothetical protein
VPAGPPPPRPSSEGPPRRGPSLSERSALTGIGDAAAPARRPPPADSARHCWVVDHPSWPGRWPGLLVEWRVRDRQWQGRVVFVVGFEEQARSVECWLDATVLVPAG